MNDDEIHVAGAAIGEDFSLQQLFAAAKATLLEDVQFELPEGEELDPDSIGMNAVGLMFPSFVEVPIEAFNAIKSKMEETCTDLIEAAAGYGVPIAGFQMNHLTSEVPPDIVDR